jgi:hypothetical protein
MPIEKTAADPKLDQNSPEYDPKLDPNSTQFDQAARDNYDNQQAGYDNSPQEETKSPGGKSPLQPAKDAIPVEQVARGRETEIKGGGDPYSLEENAQATATGRKLTKENAWEDYAIAAANKIYPRYRNTTDYAIGRKDLDSPLEVLGAAEGVEIDMGRIQEEAEFLARQDPRGPNYQPRPSLAPRPAWGEGEHRTD